MPPRRSCFHSPSGGIAPMDSRFQCHHGVPASRVPGQGRPLLLRFQCHHGVPASASPSQASRPSTIVSMPPRRSCFRDPPGPGGPAISRFNATTAFLLPSPDPPGETAPRRRFNATTAFLLPPIGAGTIVAHHGVSMPPRRSCFLGPHRWARPGLNVSMPPRRSCFLQRGGRAPHPVPVSMPPRRSCFRFRTGDLRGLSRFQCHHGVPAFVWTDGLFPRSPLFQCHHGVPASGVGKTSFASAMGFNATTAFLLEGLLGKAPAFSVVSMPPRRSCFKDEIRR